MNKAQTLLAEMNNILVKAKNENRSLNTEELAAVDRINAEVDAIVATSNAEKRAAELRKNVENVVESRVLPSLQDDVEARKFAQFRDYVFKGLEARDLQTSNGVFIPTSI